MQGKAEAEFRRMLADMPEGSLRRPRALCGLVFCGGVKREERPAVKGELKLIALKRRRKGTTGNGYTDVLEAMKFLEEQHPPQNMIELVARRALELLGLMV